MMRKRSPATTPSDVIAGLVPATPLRKARLCHMIGVAGTSQVKPGHDS
jgi:hypothetical protein